MLVIETVHARSGWLLEVSELKSQVKLSAYRGTKTLGSVAADHHNRLIKRARVLPQIYIKEILAMWGGYKERETRPKFRNIPGSGTSRWYYAVKIL